MTMRSATVLTFLTFALSIVVGAYFLLRYVLARKMTSLALVPMSWGWSVASALLNGDVPRDAYPAVRLLGALVMFATVLAILRVEGRDAAVKEKAP